MSIRSVRLIVFLLPLTLGAQNLKEFEKKVTEFTLANGLHFIVLERHEAPVVSFHTYVKAGSLEDPEGESGLAHMFEHMAFKGTESIGSRNWPEEKKAIAEVEVAYNRLQAERNAGPQTDATKLEQLQEALKAAIERADSFVEPNLYPRIIEENGGVGLNAETGTDATEYFYSLPSNRLELWFLLESQRFLHPVFREFYKERDVVMEEYRMRIESNPQGKLMQMFLATAFAAHPYRRTGAGWPSDIQNLRTDEAWQFFHEYYVPANMVMAIVGDVNPAEVKRMAEKYFGPMPKRPVPSEALTVEPKQDGPKQVQVKSPSQPMLLIGYKRPSEYDKDDAVFDVISGILGSGRTGVLYKEMVRDKKVSLMAASGDTFPDGRYPNMFVFMMAPSLGHTVADNEKTFYDILERFKAEKVSPEQLARVKTKARAGLIRHLASNAGLASLLTSYYADYGDWRKMFTSLDDLDKVTAEDVQRVAKEYFVPEGRTVAYTYQPAGGAN